MKRVVVTGIGLVSSLGAGLGVNWEALLGGRSGIAPLRYLEMPGEAVQMAAEADLGGRPERRHGNRCEELALIALDELLEQAGLDLDRGDPRRRGVFQGASSAGLTAAEAYLQDRQAGRFGRALDPLVQHPGRVTDLLAENLVSMGPRSTVMNACSSALLALGQAWERLASGELDFAVAGASEALCRTTFAGFSCLKVMDTQPCRPFSRDRAGLNLGEAGVQFLLESLDHAQARGAKILAEVLAYGATQDAHHATASHPEGDGAARAMDMALRTARICPEEIDLVSAHGTATVANDASEALAIRKVLGESQASVTASKSQFGHTLAAAGALGAVVAVLALRDQVVSPTLRLEAPEAWGLDFTPLAPRERKVRLALVNAFGFGGSNACLALRRWEGR